MSYKVTSLIEALNENGIRVIADGAFDEIAFDFSEHDKMVAEEKDKRIAKLERDLKEYKDEVIVVRKNRDEMMEGFRNGIKPYVDLCQMHERIAELEKQIGGYRERNILLRKRCTEEARDLFDCEMFGSFIITIPRKSNDNAIIAKMEEDLNRLTMDLKKRMGQIYELQEENKILKEEKDRLAEMINDLLEDDTSELEEKLKNACGENQQLKITVDVLSKRIAELMEVHEF